MKKYYLLFVAMVAVLVISCEKESPYPEYGDYVKPENSILILNEGGMDQNNSTLALYGIDTKYLTNDYFNILSKRGLGDTASDMIKYEDNIYISVNKSNTLEVIDTNTGISTKIENISEGPNKMVAHDGKIYLSSYDDTVIKIDAATLEKEGTITVGRDPEGLCVWDGKLYVANSGALDFVNNNHDETVSVIDIESFEEEEKIQVGKNPFQMYPDSKGNIYMINRATYDSDFNLVSAAAFKVLDTKTKIVTEIEGIVPSKFVLDNDIAYIVIEDYTQAVVATYDCMKEEIVKDNIIPSDFEMTTPYHISIDSKSNSLYLTETDYTTPGSVHTFNIDGVHKYSVGTTGINPTVVIAY